MSRFGGTRINSPGRLLGSTMGSIQFNILDPMTRSLKLSFGPLTSILLELRLNSGKKQRRVEIEAS